MASKYADKQLADVLKELRAFVRGTPGARLLERAEERIVYDLRLLTDWDATHARRAEELITLGNLQGAALEASLIFDTDVRHSIYDRAPLLAGADEAAERLTLNAEAGREVLA